MAPARPAESRSRRWSVRSWSIWCWSVAVAAGGWETAVHVAGGERQLAPLAARVAVYTLAGGVIWWWARGGRWAGWALLVVLGTVGLASLLMQPLGWWLGGGDPWKFLASTGPAQWAVIAPRTVHVLSVLGGVVTTARALAVAPPGLSTTGRRHALKSYPLATQSRVTADRASPEVVPPPRPQSGS